MLLNEVIQYTIDVRNRLHAIPELAMQEYQTTDLICRELEAMGAEVTRWDDLTGAVGLIRGGQDGPTIALRADIDAFTVAVDDPSSPEKEVVKHICGHDINTAVVLGAGKYFSGKRQLLYGNVKLIFQPSEEMTPGGALPMIRRGVMDNPRVDAVYGLHCKGDFNIGQIGAKPGESLVGLANFDIALRAKEKTGADPLMAMVQLLPAIKLEAARRISTSKPFSLAYSAISGGEAYIGFADRVTVKGSVQAYHMQSIDDLEQTIHDMSNGIAALQGCDAQVDFVRSHPVCYNDPRMTFVLTQAAAEVLGRENVKDSTLTLGADDMSYFLQKAPGCYFLLGITPKDSPYVRLHSYHTEISNTVLEPGVKVMTAAVEKAMEALK